MEIIEKKIDELKPYANNPRKNNEAVPAVARSIKEFGFKVPIVVDSDGVVVCGHTRLKAAKKLGLKAVPCVVADDLTEEQVRAFRIADNKTAEASFWDRRLLSEELSFLSPEMRYLIYGDTLERINNFGNRERFTVEDSGFCRPGFVYSCGRQTVVCGNSLDVFMPVFRKFIGVYSAFTVLTDPPYGVKIARGAMIGDSSFPGAKKFYEFVLSFSKEDKFQNGFAFAPGLYMQMVLEIFSSSGVTYRLFIWDKLVAASRPVERASMFAFEPFIFFRGKNSFYKKVKEPDEAGAVTEDVFRFKEPRPDELGCSGVDLFHFRVYRRGMAHATPKPVALFSRILEAYHQPGGLVVDPFLGSGTTAISCERDGFSSLSCEIEPVFCELALKAVSAEGGGEIVELGKFDEIEF